MKYGEAFEAMRAGAKIARRGWNGKGMYLVRAYNIDFDTDADIQAEARSMPACDSVAMRTADRKWVIGWLASQTDMFAEDWVVVG